MTLEQALANLKDKWEDFRNVIICDTLFGRFLVGVCDGINNILERIAP